MEYIGRILENKDIVTKEYVDNIASKTGVVELKGVESGTTATSAYSIDDYIRYIDGNNVKQIAKVTSAIAVGATIVNGTNVENISLGSDASIICSKTLYNLLSSDEKNDSNRTYYINDIYGGEIVIDDTTIASDSTWSSTKISLEISQLSGSLAGLDDVSITNPQNGQVPTYDSSTSKWVNQNLPNGGHTMAPTPSANLTESNVVTTVNAALLEGGINDDVPSNFDIGKWSNTMSKSFLVQGVAGSSTPVGTSGVGTWPADITNPTSAEKADWMCIPELYGCGSVLGLKFDLVYDPVTVSVPIARGGYVIDDNETMSDGQGGTINCAKVCLKFANEIPEADTHTAIVGVEATIKRTETVFVG